MDTWISFVLTLDSWYTRTYAHIWVVPWYGTKWMAHIVHPDQSPRLVYAIQLYRFSLQDVKILYCQHMCWIKQVTIIHICNRCTCWKCLLRMLATLRMCNTSVTYSYVWHMHAHSRTNSTIPVSILRKSISGRHRPVRVADGPMTARCRFT